MELVGNRRINLIFNYAYLITDNLIAITEAEVIRLSLLDTKQMRIDELKSLLYSSDYKVMSDYDKPNDNIKTQRQL